MGSIPLDTLNPTTPIYLFDYNVRRYNEDRSSFLTVIPLVINVRQHVQIYLGAPAPTTEQLAGSLPNLPNIINPFVGDGIPREGTFFGDQACVFTDEADIAVGDFTRFAQLTFPFPRGAPINYLVNYLGGRNGDVAAPANTHLVAVTVNRGRRLAIPADALPFPALPTV